MNHKQMPARLGQIAGILCAVAASILWSCFALITKQIYITSNISPFDMVYFRCLVPFIFTIIYVLFAGIDLLQIHKQLSFDIFARSLCWVAVVVLNFISMKIMALSRYTIILFTAPMMTSVLSYFTIGEKLSLYDFVGCVSSFAGVVIVATNPNSSKNTAVVADEPWWAFILPLVSAFMSSVGDILQRRFSSKVHFTIIQVWMYIITMSIVPLISFGAHSYEQESFKGFPLNAFLNLLLLGAVGVVAITLYMLSLKYEKAGRVAAINYLQVFNVIIIDIFYFHLTIDPRDIIGAALIIFCSFSIALLKACNVIT